MLSQFKKKNSSLKWVNAVCSDLFVRSLTVITVYTTPFRLASFIYINSQSRKMPVEPKRCKTIRVVKSTARKRCENYRVVEQLPEMCETSSRETKVARPLTAILNSYKVLKSAQIISKFNKGPKQTRRLFLEQCQQQPF